MIWLDTDVSSWSITTQLSVGSPSGGTIVLDFDKTNEWPAVSGVVDEGVVNANAWVFVKYNGQWYAGTWEWIRPGITTKHTKNIDTKPVAIKGEPLRSGWTVSSGEEIGFMVSGLARSSARNVGERSTIVMITWP